MRLNAERYTRRPRVEMVPMIDVVFLLLVFFIYAMLSMVVSRTLPVQLPEAAAAQLERRDHVSVTVNAGNELFVDSEPVTIEQVGARVRASLEGRDDATVIIHGDEKADYGTVLRVLGALRAAGVHEASFESAEPMP